VGTDPPVREERDSTRTPPHAPHAPHAHVRFSAPATEASSFYELSALDINKKPVDFASLKGKTVLVSNVASK